MSRSTKKSQLAAMAYLAKKKPNNYRLHAYSRKGKVIYELRGFTGSIGYTKLFFHKVIL